MNRTTLAILIAGLSLAAVACWAAEPRDGQQHALAEVKELGGSIIVDEKTPGKPVVGLSLCGRQVSDVELQQLNDLRDLRSLTLEHTRVSAAGLDLLRSFPKLQSLELTRTPVTDSALATSVIAPLYSR